MVILAVLILVFVYSNKSCDVTRELEHTWHIPDDCTEQFSVNAFVLAPDYLYIENANG